RTTAGAGPGGWRARSTAEFAGLRVRDGRPPSPVASAYSWQTVGEFLDREGPGTGLAVAASAIPLRDVDGGLAGLVTLSQLAAVRAEHRDTTPLSPRATPMTPVATTTPDEPPS